ncbi:heparin lyase I family protein [Mucilaginibacter sp. McL0603]|uniref:heparin lyase I family protein n=1 Tax=Mucilaginibacter sp. McL0603 TaxID=3415670 RepID=UPI003CE6CEC2
MLQLIFIATLLFTGCQKEDTSVNTIAAAKPATSAISVSSLASLQSAPVAFFDASLDQKKNLSSYATVKGDPYSAMVINPNRISVVNDPVFGSKRKVMLMDVRTQDNGGVTENPRAQVQTPMNYVEGQTVYIGFSVRFTQSFWTYFLTFSELYGAPYAGTSPFRLSIQGSNIVASATNSGKQTNLWQEPMQAGLWYDFVYCETLSHDALKGSVQVWLRKQGETTFKQVLTLTKIPTVTAANLTGPNYHKLACYYDKENTFVDASKKTRVSEIKMYLGNHKVGSSFDQVAPTLIK